jgi:hypothetical protein
VADDPSAPRRLTRSELRSVISEVHSTIAPSILLGPSITACEGVGGRRGQGRQPRGSAGEATRSALTGLNANLTIEFDGPQIRNIVNADIPRAQLHRTDSASRGKKCSF